MANRRPVQDEDEAYYHVTKCERVNVRIVGGISRVSKLRGTEVQKSDELGTYVVRWKLKAVVLYLEKRTSVMLTV